MLSRRTLLAGVVAMLARPGAELWGGSDDSASVGDGPGSVGEGATTAADDSPLQESHADARPAPARSTAPDGTYLAVLDRFEAGPGGDRLAVLVLERDGETRGQFVVASRRIPEPARHPDAVLTVTVARGGLEEVRYRPVRTRRRAERSRRRLDRLAEEPPESGDR